MARFSGTHIDWHAENRHMEHADMNTRSMSMRRWLGVVVAGIALALSSTQGMAAESLRPTVDGRRWWARSRVDVGKRLLRARV